MKKFGIIVFAVAVTAGLVLSNLFSFGRMTGDVFNFSISSDLEGSGRTETEYRDVSGFTAVEASGVFQIEIVAQKNFSVQVEADDNLLRHIRTEVHGDVLKIESVKTLRSKNSIVIRIAMPNMDRLHISGAARASVRDLETGTLDLDLSGASKAEVNGTAKRLNMTVSGAGNVDAAGLRSENANVEASGASHVKVKATDTLRIEATGASHVNYSGDPASLAKHSSGASSITQE